MAGARYTKYDSQNAKDYKSRIGEHRTGDYEFPGCELTQEQIEFGAAMDNYRRLRNRPFPTCSEVLKIIHELGYRKQPLAACRTGHAEAPAVRGGTAGVPAE